MPGEQKRKTAMSTRITLTVCEEVLSISCLNSAWQAAGICSFRMTLGDETFRTDYLILVLPHSSLCLVVISSSASNITPLQALVLHKRRKQWAKLPRVEDFVKRTGMYQEQ